MAQSQKAPTKAPTQPTPATGEGVVGKTAPTFSAPPAVKAPPADKGSVQPISTQHQPPRKGPVGAGDYGGQQQQLDKK